MYEEGAPTYLMVKFSCIKLITTSGETRISKTRLRQPYQWQFQDSPKVDAWTSRGGVIFCQILLKTAWNWKNWKYIHSFGSMQPIINNANSSHNSSRLKIAGVSWPLVSGNTFFSQSYHEIEVFRDCSLGLNWINKKIIFYLLNNANLKCPIKNLNSK